MKRVALIVIGLVTLLPASLAQAAEELTLSELFGISRVAQKISIQVAGQRREAVGDRVIAEKALRDISHELFKKDTDAERIEDAQRDVQRETEDLAKQQESGSSSRNIARTKVELAWAKRMLAATKLEGEQKRTAEREKVKAELKELQEEIKAIAKPFDDRMAELRAQMKLLQPRMIEALRPYAKTPGEPFAGKLTRVTTSPSLDVNGYLWQDADGNELAWVKIHFWPLGRPRGELLYGKYPIRRASDSGVYIYAGEMQVSIGSKNKALANKQVLMEQFQNFIDLQGLAKVKPATDAKVPNIDQVP